MVFSNFNVQPAKWSDFNGLLLIVALILGFNNKELELDISKEQQKFIIIDSVNEPPPPEAENVEYMPSDIGGPQVIPNAKFSDPILITKMPYTDKKNDANNSKALK